MQPQLTASYWNNRYQNQQTGWDIGRPSPSLLHFTDRLADKNTRILIPGAGRAYEAVQLHQSGFQQVYVCDWAADAFNALRQAAPNFPAAHLLVQDFFTLDLSFDLVLEQTFFCALDPNLRPAYVEKMTELLRPNGRLCGVFFGRIFDRVGPPFGGTEAEYRALFAQQFDILQLKTNPYSIPERRGAELLVEMRRLS